MSEVDLAALADAGAFVSREQQEHLADAFDLATWDVDATAGSFAFTDADGVVTTWRAHFLGTSSPTDGTWLWGWQNVNGFPDAFVKQARRVRALGEREGIAEFTTAALPLDDALPQRLLAAVKAVTGLTAHYSAPTGNAETRAWLLLESDALRLPEPTVTRAVGVITAALAATEVRDHRRALTAWAEQRGARLEPVGDDLLRVHLADGSLEVRFDAQRRIANMGTRLGRPVREPAPEPSAPAAPAAPEPASASAPAPDPGEPSASEHEPEPEPEPEPEQAHEPEQAPAPRPGLLQRLFGR